MLAGLVPVGEIGACASPIMHVRLVTALDEGLCNLILALAGLGFDHPVILVCLSDHVLLLKDLHAAHLSRVGELVHVSPLERILTTLLYVSIRDKGYGVKRMGKYKIYVKCILNTDSHGRHSLCYGKSYKGRSSNHSTRNTRT